MVPAVTLTDLRFSYRTGAPVLDVPELRIEKGERLFIFGPSGSGKTTLLGILSGVLAPDSGTVRVLGREFGSMSAGDRDRFRGEHIGYIFQMFNLIPYLSVLENIALPCRLNRRRMERLGGVPLETAAEKLTERLGMGAHLRGKVTELSVGQQQRVAAARALIGAPELVIADEPTSALDADHRARFLELLFEICAEAGTTLVFVSHDRQLETLFDRVASLPALQRRPSVEASPDPLAALPGGGST